MSGLLQAVPRAYAGAERHLGVSLPQDVAVDRRGVVHVTSITEQGSYEVAAFDAGGRRLGSFGTAGWGRGELNVPQGIAVDDRGDIYVVERNNGRISVFDGEGGFKRFIGALGLIYGRSYAPEGVCVAGDTVYLADTRNHRVQLFDRQGGAVVQVIGELGDGEDQFRLPTAVAVTGEGLLYVVDSKHNYIKVFSAQGQFIKKFGGPSTRAKERGLFNQPSGICLDEANNRVYVSDTLNDRIQVFDCAGMSVGVIDERGGHVLSRPRGMSLDGAGNLLVADTDNNRIYRIAGEEVS